MLHRLLPPLLLALLLAVPGLWRLGLDQAAWIAIGLALGALTLHAQPRRRLVLLAAWFVLVLAISGLLGAQGYRWITFARELGIAVTFFAAMLGASVLSASDRTARYVVIGLAFVVAVSSVASLVAYVSESLFLFRTPIGSLVPEQIAATRLGEISLISRALGTSDYFLGSSFVRPQGLFLFATSQAVAIAVFTPILLAAAAWYPALRWWFVATAVVAVAALIATTTRVPIVALPASLAAVALVRWGARGGLARLSAHRRLVASGLAAVLLVSTVLVMAGAAGPLIEVLSTRSLGSRSALYAETLEGWTMRPVLGWGTEIDVGGPDVSGGSAPGPDELDVDVRGLPPLGSHSQYLGVLFKQGLAGFAIFAAIVALLVVAAWRLVIHGTRSDALLAAAVGSTLLAGVTESIWLDPASSLVIAVAWGFVVGTAGRLTRPDPGAGPRLVAPSSSTR